MKNWILTTLCVFSFASVATADIQAPPASEFNSSRKLGRAVNNILFGWFEIPEQVFRKSELHGVGAGSTYGVVNGVGKTFKRMGYGFYELFTFYCPTYKGTFKPPYEKCGKDWRLEMNPSDGLSEFPPEIGFESYYRHSRSTTW